MKSSIKSVQLVVVLVFTLLSFDVYGQLNKAYFFNQGRYFLSREQYAEAITTLNQLLKADTTIDDAWFLRGVAKYYLNDLQGARSDFSKAIANNPVFSQAYFYRGIVQSRLSRYNLAIADFDMVIDLRPSYSLAYINRGIAYLLTMEPKKAIEDFSQTIRMEPKNVDAWINRGTARAMNADTLGAISDYRQATFLNPFYSESFSKRGRLYFEMGDNHLALSDLNKAVECDSTVSLNYFYRALIFNALKNAEEAVKNLNKTLLLNPDNALSYYNRGLVRWQIGSLNDALSDFNRVAELNPDNILIYYNRGVLLYELKKYSEAIIDFTSAISLFPDFANAYNGRSAAYAMIGNKKDSHNDRTYAQSIAEKFKDKHSQPWTDTSKKFDKLLAFSSDFSPKTTIPILERYSTQFIDIQPFIRISTAKKEGSPNLFRQFEELDRLNDLLEMTNLRLTLSTSTDFHGNLVDSLTIDDPLFKSLMQGLRYSFEKKYSEAINAFSISLSIDNKNPLVLLNLAVAQAEMTNFIASFEKDMVSVSLNHSSVTNSNSSKKNQFKEISFHESLETLNNLDEVLPNNYAVQYNKGNIFALSGEMEKALEWYTKACQSKPDLAEGWYNRGLIYLMLKETEKGCSDLGIAGEMGIKQSYLLIHKFCRQ